MRPHVLLLSALLASGAMTLPRDALAQAPSAANEAERKRLYEEGLALADTGDWAAALERFRRVVAIRSAPRALYTMAQAEERIGQLATAMATYRRALADAKAAKDTEVGDAASAAITSLDPRVPRIDLEVPAGVNDATASLDGRTVAAETASLEVNPGEHIIAVTAPGHDRFEAKVVVGPAERTTVRVQLVALAKGSEPSSPPPPPQEMRVPIGGIVLGSAGIVGLVAGAVLRVKGQSDYDAAANLCGDDAACDSQDLADEGNAGRTLMLGGTIALAAGGALLAASAIWIGVELGTADKADSAAASRVRLRAGPTGITVEGTF